jgi:hypothetical protein
MAPMKVPLIFYFSMWSQAVPIAVGILARRRLTSARVWIMFWCAIYLIVNLAAKYLASRGMNNHFLTYLALPVQCLGVMWALSLWQKSATARLTLRIAVPVFLVAFIVVTRFFENIRNFSAIAEPVYSIVALGAAIATLLSRSPDEEGALLSQDWFWVCVGLILHFGALAVLTPLAAHYLTTDPQLVIRAYVIRGYVNTAAFLVIAIGIFSPSSVRSGPFS